jgi:hypothetical protein
MLYTYHVAYLSCLTWWLIWWYVILDCYICAKSWLVCVCESICMPVLEALRTGRQIKYVIFFKKILCSSVIFFDWRRNIRLTFLRELRNIRFLEEHKLLYSSATGVPWLSCPCELIFVNICSLVMFLRKSRNISYVPQSWICSSIFSLETFIYISCSVQRQVCI